MKSKIIKHLLFILITTCLICVCNGQTIEQFKSQEIIIDSGENQIGGTLLVPKNSKIKALVIMSSGSGQQDRDETLDGFKIFKVIAEHLAENGIASYRYDDRGVGKSTGDFVNSTLQDFSNDIVQIMNHFEKSSSDNFDEFILFGHSLGGIITGDVAAQDKRVKQIVLMASPSVPLIDLILFQERQNYRFQNINSDLIEAEISSHNQLMKAISKGENTDDILKGFEKNVKNILEVHPKYRHKNNSELDQMAKNKAKEFDIVYALPSIETYLYHDPAESISKLKIPVLALFGGKDKQVTIDQNKDKLEDALLGSKTKYQIKIFNEANHYFQHAITGNREEYEQLDKKFAQGFLECISSSIINQSTNK